VQVLSNTAFDKMKMQLLLEICKQLEIPAPIAEYQFCKSRKFRLDFAWPEQKIGIEIDGGLFGQKGAKAHSSISGLLRDREKDNLLVVSGWRVLRCIPPDTKAPRNPKLAKQMGVLRFGGAIFQSQLYTLFSQQKTPPKE
jgi:hypothetical protein